MLFFNAHEWDLLVKDYYGQNPGVNVGGDEIRMVWTDHINGLPYLIKQDLIPQQFLTL
ncbi:MAG: hypothetical protein GWO23_03950, partial [Gammaproteobacteria bacterium]|nr:hypothetical protein [Gammaproteobacteria bacterium]NIX55971.1 hypothetical protein [candidate division Zixibacteria bacterium]